jgi:hypothetical protein
LRLDLADWMEQNRQIDRAKWIRLTCEYSHIQCPLEQQQPFFFGRGSLDIPLGESQWVRLRCRSLRHDVLPALFEKCGPEYWRKITGVRQQVFFGRFILTVMPRRGQSLGTIPPAEGDFDWPAATRRLGNAKWLTDAFQDGWLEALDLPLYDARQAEALLEWPENSHALPLWVGTENAEEEGFTNRLMKGVLTMPGLRGLDMWGKELALPCMRQFADLAGNLQYLKVWGLAKAGPSTRLLDQLPRLKRLRMVTLGGVLKDTQIRPLAVHPRLRHLSLDSDNLTDDDLKPFYKARVLRTLTIDGERLTRQGIQALRDANPRLNVSVGAWLRERFGPF